MGVRPEHRWLLLTAVIVGALLLLSALAMDRPNVVWIEGQPHCPGCRNQVEWYSTRCPHCGFEFDWVTADEEDSPVSPYILKADEERALKAAVEDLGADEAAKRVAAATGLSPEDAGTWLASIRRGVCGYCAGTGKHLGGEGDCPCSLGTSDTCVSVDDEDTLRVRLGDEEAARDLRRLVLAVEAMGPASAGDAGAGDREAIRELVRDYLDDHAGSVEAAQIPLMPALFEGGPAPLPAEARTNGELARGRILLALEALGAR